MSEIINHLTKDNTKKNAKVFTDYARYYDFLYQDKNYHTEADYVAGLIRKFHPAARSILEFGSGTGIHAGLLFKKGFMVHGVERSKEMLTRSLAMTEKMNAEPDQLAFSPGDIRDIRLNKHFDAVISLFHVISYQTTNEDVTAVFENARRHLNPDGIFIFDVWYGPAVLTQRPEVRVKRMADKKMEVTRLAEPSLQPNSNLVDVNYHVFVRDRAKSTVKELQENHVMRYFFKPEIELFASRDGMKILNTEEWLTGKTIGPDTWGACFLLKVLTA